MNDLRNFYRGKRVFITGHTGFKGAWLSLFLIELGAEVIGYSLDPKTEEDLFVEARIDDLVTDIRGDIRNKDFLELKLKEKKPEIVFHLAAQPLVIESYINPYETWETNVMGTINLLEVLKKLDSVKSIVIVTTDKVYKNTENDLGYSENDSLGGHDPYSSSKAAVELAVESWRNSFFANNEPQVGIATARAGNVIGGGDWGENRLIPDYFRAHLNGEMFQMRNPNSIRPWQHILDVACGYLILGMKTSQFPFEFSESYNFGPINGKYSTRDIINFLSNESSIYDGKEQSKSQYKETNKLYLNSEKARKKLLWKNFLTTERAIKLTSEYYLNFQKGNAREIIMSQIISYMGFFDEHIDEA